MNNAVGKICKSHGCPAITYDDNGFCTNHQSLVKPKFGGDLKKLPMYRTRRWQTLRLYMLKQKPICNKCKRNIATVVHHLKEARKFPDLAWCPTNLETLCASCHNRESQRESKKTNKIINWYDEL